jgi:hypothetical protein
LAAKNVEKQEKKYSLEVPANGKKLYESGKFEVDVGSSVDVQ